MLNNKESKQKIEYLGLTCESYEEFYFLYFVEELLQKGYIHRIERAESIILTEGLKHFYTKTNKSGSSGKVVTQTILQPSLYTPEFKIVWNKDSYKDLVWVLGRDKVKYDKPFIAQYRPDFDIDLCNYEELYSIIEVKPDYDQNNMTRLFKNNQKFVWDKYQLFINLIKIPTLFRQTFTPNKYLSTLRTNKQRKINHNSVNIEDYLKQFI